MLCLVPLACFMAATIGSTVAAPASKDAEPKVVQDLDLLSYTGRWYQMYASPSVYATFERNAKCVIADYHVQDYDVYNTTPEKAIVEVRNYNQDKDTNKGSEIKGTATVAAPGKLKVDFGAANMGPPSTEPNYWILAVGPLRYETEYAWAIVSNRDRSMLYILARDPDTFGKNYGKKVLALAKELGFTTGNNKPVATVHDGTCTYPVDEEAFTLPFYVEKDSTNSKGSKGKAPKAPGTAGGAGEELSPELLQALALYYGSMNGSLSPEEVLALSQTFAESQKGKDSKGKAPKATATSAAKGGELSPELVQALGVYYASMDKEGLSPEAILALGESFLEQQKKDKKKSS